MVRSASRSRSATSRSRSRDVVAGDLRSRQPGLRLHRPRAAPAAGADRRARRRRVRVLRGDLPDRWPATRWRRPTSSASPPARRRRPCSSSSCCTAPALVVSRRARSSVRWSTAAPHLPAGLQARACRRTGSSWSASASARCSASITSYLLTRAEIYDAQRATVWLTGSLNGRGWDHVRPVALGDVGAVPRGAAAGSTACGRCSSATTPPRDSACASSGRRAALIVVGVALAAVADGGGRADRVRRLRVRADRPTAGERARSRSCRPRWPARLLLLLADLVARRGLRPDRAARRRHHRHHRRSLPAVASRPGQQDRPRRLISAMTACTTPCPARTSRSPTTRSRSRGNLTVAIPAAPDHLHRRRQRVRQVDAAAGARPAAQAEGGHGAARRREHPPTAHQGGRHPARHPAAVTDRTGGHHGGRSRGARALPAPEVVPPVDHGGRSRHHRRHAVHRHHRSRDATGRRALRWPTSTSVDRDGPRTGHGPDAARRTDDVPRPRPPGRGARSARRSQPTRATHDRARAPRSQPRGPLQPPPHRDECRPYRCARRRPRK